MSDRKEMQYKITAVIPVYNREKTIKRCIDSVLSQTYPIFEIIVVDDGSSDATIDIIEGTYGEKVVLLKQRHKGAQAARNFGIKEAKGEYIAFLDSDDEWLPAKTEMQIQELQKNKNVLVGGDVYTQTDWIRNVPLVYQETGNEKLRVGARKLQRMKVKTGCAYKMLLDKSIFNFNTMLTSKANLMKIGLLDENVPAFQEWDTAIRLSKENEIAYINKPLVVYHLHDGETISKNVKRNIDGQEYICEKFKYEILSQLGSEGLLRRYQLLLKQCIAYKDRRMVIYLMKYILARFHIFILK